MPAVVLLEGWVLIQYDTNKLNTIKIIMNGDMNGQFFNA